MNTAKRPTLEAPDGEKQLLLHSCCAPCEGEVLETLLESGIHPTVFFYNPNIHPKREYDLRKGEDKRFCDKLGVEHVDVLSVRQLGHGRADVFNRTINSKR